MEKVHFHKRRVCLWPTSHLGNYNLQMLKDCSWRKKYLKLSINFQNWDIFSKHEIGWFFFSMKSFSNPTALCWNGGSHSLQRTPAAVCRIVLSEICILPAGSETVKDCMLHTVTYPVIRSDIHNDMHKQKHRNTEIYLQERQIKLILQLKGFPLCSILNNWILKAKNYVRISSSTSRAPQRAQIV